MGPHPQSSSGDRWLSIGDLARARAVSGEAITQELKRLARRGTPVETRPGLGRKVMVNVREYERCRGEAVSLAHVALEETKAAVRGLGQERLEPLIEPRGTVDTIPIGTYTEAQARKTAYDAELKKVDLDKALGRTIDRAELTKAAVDGAATMAAVILRLHRRAEEIRTVDQRDGLVGLRTFLKLIERDMMAQIAEEFSKLAAAEIAKE